jgi:glutathione S-transferase
MTVTVYGVVGSPLLRSALLGLEERAVPYALVGIPMGAHLEPPHLARHPFGRVPVFDHDGFALYETQAILRYVAKVFPGEPLEPADARAAARMNQLMGITDWYFYNSISTAISRPRIFAMRYGKPADEAAIKTALPGARICMQAVDDLKGDHAYLAGNALSLADLLLAPQMANFALTPEGKAMLAAHPRLAGWLDHMATRPSMLNTATDRLARAA